MKKPDIPDDERARVTALHRLEILDTAREVEFQDIVEMASRISGCPISLVSLVDTDRQWFKAAVGLEAPQTSRDISFCAHAIHQVKLFEVTDTLADVRFKDNPLVVDDPSIRFYAGQPLVTSGGNKIGTLCVIDRIPKRLSGSQKDELQALARITVRLLEGRVALRNLENEKVVREKFVNTLTHDLRTPLSAARLNAQLLERKPTADVAVIRKMCQRIIANTDKANRMIGNLLDANHLEAGQGIPIKVDDARLDDIVAESIATMTSLYGERFRLVTPAHPVEGRWDAHALERVLENLCANAIKYGARDEAVVVRYGGDASEVFFSVNNRGKPIAATEWKAIFLPYTRTEESFRGNQRGWGIGLALVKGIAEAHRGRVELESSPSAGTTFTVHLPKITESAP